MNEDFIPPAARTLEDLLNIIADPKKAQEYLGHLKKEIATLNKLSANVDARVRAHEAKLETFERLVAEHNADLDKREADILAGRNELKGIEARRTDLARDEELRSHAVNALTAIENQMKDREEQIAHKETELRNTAAALDTRAQKLATAERDLNDRMARLRALAG